MPTIEVLTVSESLPAPILDRVLTATEEALLEAGASRIWLTPGSVALTVMAELPESPQDAP
jgi:hypothetical protein